MKSNLLLLLLLLCGSSIAQVSTSDFFPLAVGNSWTYTYYNRDIESPGDFRNIYSGTASYKIISKTITPDSIIWTFQENRNVEHWHYIYGNPNWDSTWVSDSTLFELIEYQSTNHRLIVRSGFPAPYSFLCRPFTDSLWFSRYAPDTLRDTLAINQSWRHNQWRLSASFQRRIGLIHLSYTNSFPTGHDEYVADTLLNAVITPVPRNELKLPLQDFVLNQNFPNPFNPITTISFLTITKSNTTIKIYDILGRLVETIFNGRLAAGDHFVIWNASRQSSGIYYSVANVNGTTKSIKLSLLK